MTGKYLRQSVVARFPKSFDSRTRGSFLILTIVSFLRLSSRSMSSHYDIQFKAQRLTLGYVIMKISFGRS